MHAGCTLKFLASVRRKHKGKRARCVRKHPWLQDSCFGHAPATQPMRRFGLSMYPILMPGIPGRNPSTLHFRLILDEPFTEGDEGSGTKLGNLDHTKRSLSSSASALVILRTSTKL